MFKSFISHYIGVALAKCIVKCYDFVHIIPLCSVSSGCKPRQCHPLGGVRTCFWTKDYKTCHQSQIAPIQFPSATPAYGHLRRFFWTIFSTEQFYMFRKNFYINSLPR